MNTNLQKIHTTKGSGMLSEARRYKNATSRHTRIRDRIILTNMYYTLQKAAAILGQEEQTFHNIKIIMTHIKNTTDKVHSAVDSLRIMLPEDGPVRPKHVAPTQQ
jgi:hypothetical protein